MMTDPLSWSPINLGRWGGTQVRIHFFLVAYVVIELLMGTIGGKPVSTACWLLMLLAALAAHEFGHAAMAWWLGAEPEEVRLWPLGNMVGPSHPARPADNILVALAGPAVSAAMVLTAAGTLGAMGYQFVWSPFGSSPSDPGAPLRATAKAGAAAPRAGVVATVKAAPAAKEVKPTDTHARPLTPPWFVGWFGYVNWVILLANLLPALPFDNGRVFRAYLAQASVSTTKDSMIAPLFARSCALILVIVGLVRLLSGRPDGLQLIVLAILIEMIVRTEARMMEDGGFFDDGVFGYDFSEGYTSLEGNAAKVRPYRESALKRWRRRRSDLRRQRRQAREAAEERRMDEILEKLHREGRAALTDEEHRFLIRVSAKYRNKPRAHD